MRATGKSSARQARGWRQALLAGCVVLSAASLGFAAEEGDGSVRALAFGKQGAAAYESGDHAAAIEHFDRASALLPAPSLQLWAARSCAKLGRLVEAQRRYRDALRLTSQVGDPAIQLEAQRSAKQELEQLSGRIPLLGVRVLGTSGQPARLALDEQPFEGAPGQLTPVDPGQHVLLGRYRGQTVSLSVELAEGQRRELVVEFAPPTTSEPFPAAPGLAAAEPVSLLAPTSSSSARIWRAAGWMGVGAGGALLLTGIVTGSVAQQRYDALQGQPGCSRTRCGPEERSNVDRYHSMRTVSLVTSIGGAVLATAGAGLLLFVPRSEEGGLALSPGGVAWSGTF